MVQLRAAVKGHPKQQMFHLQRELLEGVLLQHSSLLMTQQRMMQEHKSLLAYVGRLRLGPGILNGLMKMFGGGIA
jgi:hypothetical protein